MFCGACAGSTGGGIKVSRIAVMVKTIKDELSKIIHPRAVKKVRLENKVVSSSVVNSIFTFLMGYFAIFIVSLLTVSLDNFDFATNFSATAATINNIGPGISLVGPYENFSQFSDLSKLVFCFNMIAGRLEILPMLVLINPKTWSLSFKFKQKRQTKKSV